MGKREVLAIAIKVFSLWFICQLFIQAATFTPALMSLASWRGNQIPTWAYFAFPACFIIAGLIIALLLSKISNSVLNSFSTDSNIELNQTNQNFVLQIAGLFFIVSSLTYLPSTLSIFISSTDIKAGYYLRPLGYVIQFTIGLWLTIHPTWWVLLFNKFRGRA
jgi:hypothetical protein